ncbi:odorant receptor, partial [Clarias magur]
LQMENMSSSLTFIDMQPKRVIFSVLYILNSVIIAVVRAACAFIVLLSASTFVNGPLNLTVMSLE